MRWTGSIARTGAKRNAYRNSLGNPEEKRPGWKIILKWTLAK
jgi:hypothetical protein